MHPAVRFVMDATVVVEEAHWGASLFTHLHRFCAAGGAQLQELFRLHAQVHENNKMDSTELAALVMKLEPSVSVPDLRFFQALCDAGGAFPRNATQFAALCLEMKELCDLLECGPARHDLGGLVLLLAGVARRDE